MRQPTSPDQQVVELLRRGRTVAWVADATTLPRTRVVQAAANAGLVHDSSTDTCRARDDTAQPPPTTPTSTDHVMGRIARLLTDAEASTQHRTRLKAAKLKALAAELDQLLTRERQQAEARAELARLERRRAELFRIAGINPRQPATQRTAELDYPVREVRRWAREQGLPVPSHGRYLPAEVVQAWRAAQAEAAR